MWKNMQSDSLMTFLFGQKDLWTKFMMDELQNDKVEKKKINNSSLLLPPSGKYTLNKYLQRHQNRLYAAGHQIITWLSYIYLEKDKKKWRRKLTTCDHLGLDEIHDFVVRPKSVTMFSSSSTFQLSLLSCSNISRRFLLLSPFLFFVFLVRDDCVCLFLFLVIHSSFSW